MVAAGEGGRTQWQTNKKQPNRQNMYFTEKEIHAMINRCSTLVEFREIQIKNTMKCYSTLKTRSNTKCQSDSTEALTHCMKVN